MHVTTFRAADSLLSLLDGTWLVMAGKLGGVRLPDNAFDDLTLTLRNGRFELGQDRGRIGLDCRVAPAALDVLIIDGPNRGRFVPAIVERAGPVLHVCYDLGGTQRPAAFQAPAGTRYFLTTYRRAS
jgi:uncharacterized protein (TIGR03067 family)